MDARDVAHVVRTLEGVGVPVWLDGGWGIDALVGRATRTHDDVDVAVPLDAADAAHEALVAEGFRMRLDERPTRFVMDDARGRSIDFHTITFDEGGGGVQALPAGTVFRYPPEGFAGHGIIDGQHVRCLTPEVQALCHLGYEPDGKDYHDMGVLRDFFGIELPAPYRAHEER